MVTIRAALAMVALVLLPAAANAQAEQTIQLGVGTQKVLTIAGGVSRVAVGDPRSSCRPAPRPAARPG